MEGHTLKITKLTAEILSEDMEALSVLLKNRFRLNDKKTGTFVEGLILPESFAKYAVLFPRGGAIIPNTNPDDLNEMIHWATSFRFAELRERLEKDLGEIFGVPIPLKLHVQYRCDSWILRVNSPAIPCNWWNDDVGGDDLLTECFFEGSVKPIREFWGLDEWVRQVAQHAHLHKIHQEQRRNAEEALLRDPNHSLNISMFVSNSKSHVVMDTTGTPVQLLQEVFGKVWMWQRQLEFFKRGFRIKVDGRQEWTFYKSTEDLLVALQGVWPVAYERAEQEQS